MSQTGAERLVADPRTLGGGRAGDLPPEERARRERVREQAGGIVTYATDADLTVAVFGWSGRVFAVDLPANAAPREVAVPGPVLDPRPDPAGKRLAYVRRRRAAGSQPGQCRRSGPGRRPGPGRGRGGVTFGLPEFIAAEEMGRTRGYWWSPDGSALLVARVDETPVNRWHIADPANPDRTPAEVAYPAAGTPNAAVSLLLARLDGTTVDGRHRPRRVPVPGHRVPGRASTTRWCVVQSRDQRRMRLLTVDAGTGRAEVLHEDTDPRWLEIVPGVPAWTADGRLVWTADREDTRRLIIGAPGALAQAEPVTPPGLQVRAVLDVDGDTVLFQASAEPAEIGLWSYGPDGLRRLGPRRRRRGGDPGRRDDGGGPPRSGPGRRDGPGVPGRAPRSADIASLAESPALPAPRPVLFGAGPRGVPTAVLFPSWHEPGQGKLPVLLDPYGGPHAQRVLAARSAYLTAQWFAEQGFAVVIADGRGTPGAGPQWERAVAGDLAGPVLEDQVDALREAAARFGDLDTERVAIRGWSFGGLPGRAGGAAPPGRVRRGDRGRAGHRLAPLRHPLHRALPGRPEPGPGGRTSGSSLDQFGRTGGRARGRSCSSTGWRTTTWWWRTRCGCPARCWRPGTRTGCCRCPASRTWPSQEAVAENLLLLQLDFLRGALGLRS